MKAAPALEITFLGTGTSQGVPMIGCDCAVCRSTDPRDHRLRTAARIRTPEIEFVIDTPPDFRTQALRANLRRVDAVLFTHTHTDHIMGFDDLRRFCELQDAPLPIHGTPHVLEDLARIFPFAFDGSAAAFRNYMRADPRPITGPFELGDLHVAVTPLPHGRFTTTGFIFSRAGRRLLAYYTDCNALPPEAIDLARGVEVLVIDALRPAHHPTHLSHDEALTAARAVAARRTLFIHKGDQTSHAETEAALPPDVRVAYDGQTVTVP